MGYTPETNQLNLKHQTQLVNTETEEGGGREGTGQYLALGRLKSMRLY